MSAGQKLVRINLSEQTDMMDLLGADLPVQGGAPGQFAWSAPYLLAVPPPPPPHLAPDYQRLPLLFQSRPFCLNQFIAQHAKHISRLSHDTVSGISLVPASQALFHAGVMALC